MKKTRYEGIFEEKRARRKGLFTKSLDGKTFFNENLVNGYREIDPRRSKLGAAVIKGISKIPVRENDKVLYLGAGHGYTASFISDIVKNGVVYCVEFAPRVMRDLILLCEDRGNMVPIFASANQPERYNYIEKVDVIYQDVAQRNQVDILFKNLIYLKNKGYAILCVKSRSIDVTKRPKLIFYQIKDELRKKLKIIDSKDLNPLEKDHFFFVCQRV